MTKNDAVERAVTALDRIQLAVKRLGEQSGYNKQTYFEAPILAMPSVQKREDAQLRWMELNDALVACNQASAELQALQTSRPDEQEMLAALDRICEHVGATQYAATHRDIKDIQAIRAALKSGDKGRWQKIDENTPVDKDLWMGAYAECGNWRMDLAVKAANGIIWNWSWGVQPTHWMMPELPPTSEGV